jgi:chorismate dehydratase
MIFGKIEYLNLLPFHVFMKRFGRNSQTNAIMNHKKNVPAKINDEFMNRRVDAAFISSIQAKKYKHVNLGIIAKKEVRSVLVIPSRKSKIDKESASSNVLARILKQNGEVLIGDKALRYALKSDDYTDLAALWHEKQHLPFVFALLCYHKDKKLYKKIEREFLKKEQKIPYYLLQKAAKRTEVKPKEIVNYLKLISYKLDSRAKLGLEKFYKEAKRV